MKKKVGVPFLFILALMLLSSALKKIQASYYLDWQGNMRYESSQQVLGSSVEEYNKEKDNHDNRNKKNNQIETGASQINNNWFFERFFDFFRASQPRAIPTPKPTTSLPIQENTIPTTTMDGTTAPTIQTTPNQTPTDSANSISTQPSSQKETSPESTNYTQETPSEYFANSDEIINLQNVGGEISVVKEYKSGAKVDYGTQKKFVIEAQKPAKPAQTIDVQEQQLEVERKVDYGAIQEFLEQTNQEETQETIEIFSTEDGYMVFAKGTTGAKTRYALSINPANNQLLIRTESGLKNIVFLPDEAIAALVKTDVLHSVSFDSSTNTDLVKNTIPLEIINGIPVYKIVGERKGKLLNILPVSIAKQIIVSAENAEVIKEDLSLLNRLLNALSY